MSKNEKGIVKRAKLNLIDLAGSEKYKNLGDCETLHKESNNINKSLHHLSNCIIKLSQGDRHIPYRDSLLTRYLTDTLGGNSNTVIICTASRLKSNSTHTKMTLEFGLCAQKIKTHPVAQIEYSVEDLKKVIKKLQNENKELKKKVEKLLNTMAEEKEDDKLYTLENFSEINDFKRDD